MTPLARSAGAAAVVLVLLAGCAAIAYARWMRPAAAGVILIVSAVTATLVRLLLAWVSQRFVYGLQQDLVMAVYGRVEREGERTHQGIEGHGGRL